MKKIINKPENVVYEMLEGLVAANPNKFKHIPEKKILVRHDAPVKGKVAVLTGSGSGHEPDQVWYVGKGMMDAACAGEVFAAPTADAVYEATKMVDAGAGVLYLITLTLLDDAVWQARSLIIKSPVLKLKKWPL